MALVKCPKCGQMLSSFAKVCSNCGWNATIAEEVGKSFTTLFDNTLRKIVNLPYEKLINMANESRNTIMKYLFSIYDRKTAAEIFMSFVSICFATDGQLSYNEYKLLLSIVDSNGFSFEVCANLVQCHLKNNSNEINEVIKNAPREIRGAFADLCVVISAIDGTITLDETRMCYRYFVLAI